MIICHADGGPMWARGTPEPVDSGSGLSAIIKKGITRSNSIPELETVFDEHSGNFTFINCAAAITKYAKLRGGSMGSPFFSKLGAVWLNRLPDSGAQGYSNVSWACGKLGSAHHPVWDKTWQAFLELVGKDLRTGQAPSLLPQDISNVLYACGKLRKQPHPDELMLLLQAFVDPVVLPAATSQEFANVVWALSMLSVSPKWEAQVSFDLLQQLLALPLLQKVAADGKPQELANALIGLGRMCAGPSPLLPAAAAQGFARQVLSHVRLNRLSSLDNSSNDSSGWSPQAITNIMMTLVDLQLYFKDFFEAAAAAAAYWLPRSTALDLTQAATACAQLQYWDEHFMALLLQRGQQLLQPNSRKGSKGRPHTRSRGRPSSEADKGSIASTCCVSVVSLDMRGLAGEARKLAADSSIKHQGRAHLRRLWVFHGWLLEHQLLDGKGLAGVLSEQQLQQGDKEAVAWGDKSHL